MDANVSLRSGTICGTLLSIAPLVGSGELLRTAILALVGAVVSYLATLLLKWLSGLRKKPSNHERK